MASDNAIGGQMLLKNFTCDDGTKISYYCPSQVREIPLKQCSIRGYIPSLKPHLPGEVWNYESQLERNFLYLLDHDPNCIDLQTQPCQIEYLTKNNKKVKATPDIWAIFQDGTQMLFEVKPATKLKTLEKDENWQRKIRAIVQYCKDLHLNWSYQIVTDRHIQCIRLNNIKDLLGAAKHYSPAKINFDLGHFNSAVNSILQKRTVKFRPLVEHLEQILLLHRNEIISILKYKIYFCHLHMNWDAELEKTNISRRLNHPIIPIYQLPESNTKINDIFLNESPEEKIVIYSEQAMQKFQNKMDLLAPIIKQFGKSAKKSQISDLCKAKHYPFYSVYRWYLTWKKEGQDGLYPKPTKFHKTCHLKNKLASKILKSFIIEWNMGEWQTYVQAYKDYVIECLKLNISKQEIPSLQTFRNWIRKLPAVEQRGKFRPKHQKYIKKAYRSTYQKNIQK